jgi:hypothetical protein
MTVEVRHPVDFEYSILGFALIPTVVLAVLSISIAILIRYEVKRLVSIAKESHLSIAGREVFDFPSHFLSLLVISAVLFTPLFWPTVRDLEVPLPLTWIDVVLMVLIVFQLGLAICVIWLRIRQK